MTLMASGQLTASPGELDSQMTLTVVILTRDEEKHIRRCIQSVIAVADHCVVVDSGSIDNTVEIARSMGAQVLVNPWINYATQFNWAIRSLPADTEWILRLDADEVVSAELLSEIHERLPSVDDSVEGVYLSRRMKFLGHPIRWGGLFPLRVLRLFRSGRGRCEDRWMDEHILVSGKTIDFSGEIVDDNLNTITWWIQKHNAYASREVVDLLNLEFGLMPFETVASLRDGQQAGLKRWFKERAYVRLPVGMRAFLYFVYRYIIRLGFLDGFEGTAFHVLQGFWYRYLVDIKLYETRKYMKRNGVDAVVAIRDVLGIEVSS